MAWKRNLLEILFCFSMVVPAGFLVERYRSEVLLLDFLLVCLLSVPITFLLQFYRSRGLFLDITVTYYLPPIDAGELKIATQAATFRRTIRLPRANVTGEAARAAVAAALRELHVDDEAEIKDHSDHIVIKGGEHMASSLERRSWITSLVQKIRFETQIDLCVDVLPPRTGLYIGALSTFYHDSVPDGEDDGVRIVRVSKESAEGLVRAAEKTEEAVTCQVCFEEAPAGSQMTRLPCCHHRYHMPCIIWWLEESKLCPLNCGFHLP